MIDLQTIDRELALRAIDAELARRVTSPAVHLLKSERKASPAQAAAADVRDAQALNRLLRSFDTLAQTQVRSALERLRGRTSLAALEKALEIGIPVERVIPWATLDTGLRPVLRTLQDAYRLGGRVANERIAAGDQTFELTNPEAVKWADQNAARRVTRISEDTREAIREVTLRGQLGELTVQDQARAIRSLVGQTGPQTRATERLLDGMLADGVDPEDAQRSIDRKVQRNIKDRARMIARTETLTALNEGQLALWQKGMAEGYIPDHARKRWIVTDDDLLDPRVCRPMRDQEVPVDEPFITGEGEEIMAPAAHPQCRCTMSLIVDIKAAKDWDPALHPREPAGSSDGGQFTEAGGGDGGGGGSAAGDPGEGGGRSLPQQRERYDALKTQWAHINNAMLDSLDEPDSPEALAKLDHMKAIVKEMYTLDVDPGGLEGIGLPGGPRDVVIVGAGPGGLSSAIMAGTDGLDTLLIDANTVPGGQAKFSSRVENYPGFPVGASGEHLTHTMFEQAQRVGAETKLGVRVSGIAHDPTTDLKTLTMEDGSTVQARTVIVAGGVEFRKVNTPGFEATGVIYGDAKEAAMVATGAPAVIVGGSNGAAQAALGVAKTATHVTVVSRSPIAKGMSDYQVSALRNHPKITVLEGEQITEALAAGGHVTGVTLKSGKTLPAKAVGVFMGSAPNTSWTASITKDKDGKLVADPNYHTSMPGVFAVGDVRAGSIGRIGAAVGEGQFAVRNVFQYFGQRKATTAKKALSTAKPKRPCVWNGMVDQAFTVDEAHPWLGQTIEPEPIVEAKAWDESEHPREPGGSSVGGRFAGGGSGEPQIYMRPENLENTGEHWVDRTRRNILSAPLSHDTLPEELYHVTTALGAVESSGILRGAFDGGGLGGGNDMKGVSLTTSRADADLMQRELRRHVETITLPQDMEGKGLQAHLERYAVEDAKAAGLPPERLQRAVDFAMGNYRVNVDTASTRVFDYEKYGGYGPRKPAAEVQSGIRTLHHEAHNQYNQLREGTVMDALGVPYQRFKTEEPYARYKDPMILGDAEHFARMDPAHIGTVVVPRGQLPAEALIRQGSDSFLHEIRVHADIPLRPRAAKHYGPGAHASGSDQDVHGHRHGEHVLNGPPARDPTATPGSPLNPIQCGADLTRAARLLGQGQWVELDQPRSISTFLDKLNEMATEAIAKGEDAPLYDLCKVSVPGTNLFCLESLDIPRVRMPQFASKNPTPGSIAAQRPRNSYGEVNLAPEFRKFLESRGYEITEDTIDARMFRATQSEINGAKVAAIAARLASLPEASVWVSKDDYVIDGHHRWAALTAESYRHGHPLPMKVTRVNLDIATVLNLANFWTEAMGLPAAAVKHYGPGPHPGTGTDQAVHGSGTGHVEELHARLSVPDGGFTVNPFTGTEPTTGFMVSRYPERSWSGSISSVTPKTLARYIKRNRDLAKQPNHYIGAWHDPETGTIWLDVAWHTDSRANAVGQGRKYNQIAYFDLKAGKSVALGGTGHAKGYEAEAVGADVGRRGAEPGADRGVVYQAHGQEDHGARSGGHQGGAGHGLSPYPRGLSPAYDAWWDSIPIREWDEAQHPRVPAGETGGGQFTEGGDHAGAAAGAESGGLRNGGGISGGEVGVAAPGSTADPAGPPLAGLPPTVAVPGRGRVAAGPHPPARQAALDYMATTGRPYNPPSDYVTVDPERAAKIAAAYDAMPHAPNDPEVKAAYQALIDETVAQYQVIKATGLKVEAIDYEKQGDPYAASPRLSTLDVIEHNHLWFFPTDAGFGSSEVDVSDNPLLAPTNEFIGERRLVANDVFRIVHDYFGHVKEGVGFRADGEENAWRSHSAMFSPQARRAMTSETRGQNSVVNFGPHGEANRTASAAKTIYADQKTGLLPEWVSEDQYERSRKSGRSQGSRASHVRRRDVPDGQGMSGLQPLVGDDVSLLQPRESQLSQLWGQGDHRLARDADLARIPERDGIAPDADASDRPHQQQRAVRSQQRPVGNPFSKSPESATEPDAGVRRQDADSHGVGRGDRDDQVRALAAAQCVRLACGGSVIDAVQEEQTPVVYADQKTGLLPEWISESSQPEQASQRQVREFDFDTWTWKEGDQGSFEWDESLHPRVPAGVPEGGRFVSVQGVAGRVSEREDEEGFLSMGSPIPPGEGFRSARADANAKAEHKLLTQRVVEFKPLQSGGVSESKKAVFEDGSKAIWKPDGGAMEGIREGIEGQASAREVAAWEVAKLVGMDDLVAPAVLRSLDEEAEGGEGSEAVLGSLARWEKGTTAKHINDDEKKYQDHDPVAQERAAIFDFVIGNTDRHAGNWLIGKDETGKETFRLIDHNLSFPDGKLDSGGNYYLIDHLADVDIHDPDTTEVAKYTKAMPAIAATMKKMGLSNAAIQGVKDRAAMLASGDSWSAARDHIHERVDYDDESGGSGSGSPTGDPFASTPREPWRSPKPTHTPTPTGSGGNAGALGSQLGPGAADQYEPPRGGSEKPPPSPLHAPGESGRGGSAEHDLAMGRLAERWAEQDEQDKKKPPTRPSLPKPSPPKSPPF